MKRFSRGIALLLGLTISLVGIAGISGWFGPGFNFEGVVATLQDFSPLETLPSRQATADLNCANWAPLVPRVRPGPALERHRHSLELIGAYDGSAYLILNSRTGAIYQWGYEGPNNTAQAVFGVPTGFAILNPGWEHDPWVLLYHCN